MNEKKILSICDFPFIMNYRRSYKDDLSVYFLLEFINGMEMFDAIREIGLLDRTEAQFYIGTLILCMEYMHSLGYVYRDIKPENCMVDHKGVFYLIDLGTARDLKDKSSKTPDKTFTIIGIFYINLTFF